MKGDAKSTYLNEAAYFIQRKNRETIEATIRGIAEERRAREWLGEANRIDAPLWVKEALAEQLRVKINE